VVFVCYFSDPFVGGGWDVLSKKAEGFCGEDCEWELGWWYDWVFEKGLLQWLEECRR
jgi:hypothetical protein